MNYKINYTREYNYYLSTIQGLFLRRRLDLKDCKLGLSLSLLSNFDHIYICGPKYLREVIKAGKL